MGFTRARDHNVLTGRRISRESLHNPARPLNFRHRSSQVEVSPEGVLTITAERKEEAGQRSSRSFGERFRGRFRRSVRLPKSAAPEGITAKLEDGVLTLVVPKLETESPENRIINIGDDSGPASMEFPPSPAE